MRIFFLSLIVGFIYLIINTALLSFFLPVFIIPDLLVILVFYLAVSRPSWKGALASFILGYFADVFSGGTIGVSSFSLTFVFFIIYSMSKKIDFNIPFVRMLWVCIAVILNAFLTYAILRIIGPQREILYSFLKLILPNAFISGIVSPFIFNMMDSLKTFLDPLRKVIRD